MDVTFHNHSPDLQLHSAILLYQDTSTHSIAYASTHEIGYQGDDKVPYIKAGSPVTRESVADAYTSLIGGKGLQMIDDDRILAVGIHGMAFFTPGKPRHVLFDCPEPMGKQSGTAPHPSLVFVVGQGKLAAYAIKGSVKPNGRTPLYHAPYMNIYDTGSMCMGNIVTPHIRPTTEAVNAWEHVFFGTYFTHANNARTVHYPGGVYALWQDLLDSGQETFPDEVLLPIMRGEQQRVLADLF